MNRLNTPNSRFVLSSRRSTRVPMLAISVAALVMLVLLEMSGVRAATAPKAYIGLFKDNAVAVVDTGTNKLLTTIPVPAGPHGLAVTPDGKTVYVSSDGDSKVSIIDTATDKVTSSIEVGKTPHGLALSQDGKLLLVAGFGTDSVLFVDTATNKVTGTVSVPKPHNLAISPDGKTAYVASQLAGALELAILNLTDKTMTGMVKLDKTPRALNFSHDGKHLYFTLLDVPALQVLDVATNAVTTQIAVGASPHHPFLTEEYGFVVSQTTNELTIFDPTANTVKGTVTVGKNPHWIATSADGDTVYVTNEASNDVSVVNVDTQKVIATIPVGQAPRKIVIQPATTDTDVKATPASTPAK